MIQEMFVGDFVKIIDSKSKFRNKKGMVIETERLMKLTDTKTGDFVENGAVYGIGLFKSYSFCGLRFDNEDFPNEVCIFNKKTEEYDIYKFYEMEYTIETEPIGKFTFRSVVLQKDVSLIGKFMEKTKEEMFKKTWVSKIEEIGYGLKYGFTFRSILKNSFTNIINELPKQMMKMNRNKKFFDTYFN